MDLWKTNFGWAIVFVMAITACDPGEGSKRQNIGAKSRGILSKVNTNQKMVPLSQSADTTLKCLNLQELFNHRKKLKNTGVELYTYDLSLLDGDFTDPPETLLPLSNMPAQIDNFRAKMASQAIETGDGALALRSDDASEGLKNFFYAHPRQEKCQGLIFQDAEGRESEFKITNFTEKQIVAKSTKTTLIFDLWANQNQLDVTSYTMKSIESCGMQSDYPRKETIRIKWTTKDLENKYEISKVLAAQIKAILPPKHISHGDLKDEDLKEIKQGQSITISGQTYARAADLTGNIKPLDCN